jgi:hypothetical protein
MEHSVSMVHEQLQPEFGGLQGDQDGELIKPVGTEPLQTQEFRDSDIGAVVRLEGGSQFVAAGGIILPDRSGMLHNRVLPYWSTIVPFPFLSFTTEGTRLTHYLISANLPLDNKCVIPEALLIGNPVLMNSQQLPFDKLRRALSKHLLEENYELLQVHQLLYPKGISFA